MGIKVLVVDDSSTSRAVLKEILLSDKSIESVTTAPDAYIARDKIVRDKPDVVCLDVEMPKMDGVTFLKKLMKYSPLPVVMVSSHTSKNAKVTLDALDSGAVDFVLKPQVNLNDCIDGIRDDLLSKVKNAAIANIFQKAGAKNSNHLTKIDRFSRISKKKIIAIGASTGGVQSIKEVLINLPKTVPGVVIVQHMPAGFTNQFAQRLNGICDVEVCEAKNGDKIERGKVFIAPGDKHMVIRKSYSGYYIEIGAGEKVNGHRPSVGVLFNSVAKYANSEAIGVLLTGMGQDGARALLNMKNVGAFTIAQDRDSSIVYGMPKVAMELNAALIQIPLNQVGTTLEEIVKRGER